MPNDTLDNTTDGEFILEPNYDLVFMRFLDQVQPETNKLVKTLTSLGSRAAPIYEREQKQKALGNLNGLLAGIAIALGSARTAKDIERLREIVGEALAMVSGHYQASLEEGE